MLEIIITLTYIILISLIVFLSYKYIYYRGRVVQIVKDVILNPEELEKHGKDIALSHSVSLRAKSSYMLLPRMEDNYRFIIKAYRDLNADMTNKKSVVPAAEWLLDNFYVIEEHIKEIRLNFSKGYYAALPRLTNGVLRGFPRVYAIALELVSHTDGRLDERTITNFIKAYQSKSHLTSGELWAIPIMLRIALVENIRGICEDILNSQNQRKEAQRIGDIILNETDGEKIFEILKENVESMDVLEPTFAEQLLQMLRRHGSDMGQVIRYIDERLAAQDMSVEQVIQFEHQNQAKKQVSIGNSITSLRFVSSLDWSEIFELLSPVEQILRKDPANVYGAMDFASRDYYRHEVEEIARTLKISEVKVAKAVLECGNLGSGELEKHVGYYIVGEGRDILENNLGYKASTKKKLIRLIKKHPTGVYLSSVSVITLIILWVLALYGFNRAYVSAAFIMLLLAAVPSSEIAVGITNWTITHILKPSFLPKLELKDGIPQESAGVVVIPTLLPNSKRVKEIIDQLEVYYLANQDKNLYFALLGDFVDGKSESMPGDDDIVKAAVEGIKELNKRYNAGEEDIFYFFHRFRKYNPSQGVWMGWERKRGKLVEFNELLMGSNKTTYYIQTGKLPRIKYVITLDADTELPMGAAKRLIGTISHPLNRPVIDKATGRIVRGYGILQPRVSIGATNANMSYFSRIFAGQGGIDPYTTAVSDVYQDLLGEGIYTGKGIYDVEAFESALNGYIPENAVLSHDLLEGSFARAGLVTDIEFVDGFPSKYSSYMARLHRWVRGDWQLIPWLRGSIRNHEGQYVKNPLSIMSRWKIFDNLRRSLISPSLIILIILSLIFISNRGLLWFTFIFLTIAFPILGDMVNVILTKSKRDGRNYTVMSGLKNILYQIVLMFIFLPYQAYMMIDAILKTLVRVLITKKNMLEWETAADAEKRLKNDIESYIKSMWISIVVAIFIPVLTFIYSPSLSVGAVLLGIVWAISPYAAYVVSKPKGEEKGVLSQEDIKELRRIFRKTWRYFEDFIGPEDNFMPPDNFQEEPVNGIAHRTSPTNIGLLLISTLAACDMGYITVKAMLERLQHTFDSMEKMDKWKGHFYNWYDTKTLQTLRPLYVSTVDSGNLVGYLITLKQGLKEYTKRPIVDKRLSQGLMDTLNLLDEEISESLGHDSSNKDSIEALKEIILTFDGDVIHWYNTLNKLKDRKSKLNIDGFMEKSVWSRKIDYMIGLYMSEIEELMPWVKVLSSIPEAFQSGDYKDKLDKIISKLNSNNLKDLSEGYKEGISEINAMMSSLEDMQNDNLLEWLKGFKSSVMNSYLNTNKSLSIIKNLMEKCQKLVDETDFRPLFDEKRQLFSIGYSAEEEQLNKSYYDLLASEARQTSFIAIAKGDIDQKHWFRLGRPVTVFNRYRGLVSWSGTMFEYLMPMLIMKNYKNTLLDETYRFVVKCQKAYGKSKNVPWGVSECAYNAFDISLNYQYKAFGIPRLGLKRGLANDMVVAPYATLLALPIEPSEAVKNIYALKNEGLEGPYGLYEAIDYTKSRMTDEKKGVVIKNFMVHHHGMSILSLDNFLNNNIMQERFHREPMVKAGELLLQEKVSNRVVVKKDVEEEALPVQEKLKGYEDEFIKVIKTPLTPISEAHILSNGNYSVVLTNKGTGFSKLGGTNVTRWREDTTLDNYGMFIYIQNINSNSVWSATYEPYKLVPEGYKCVFTSDKVEYFRVDGNIDTHTEIVVSPEDNVEVRRVSLTNHSDHSRVIELTSYFEVVMSHNSADVAHPAFNNLFVKTEFVQKYDSLLASRRPRTPEQKPSWLVHTVTVEDGETIGTVQYETDRAKFIGRGRTSMNPVAMDVDHPLSNSSGAVLDPVMSLRRRIRIAPGKTARVSYIIGISDTRKQALEIAQKYRDSGAVDRAFELAWTRSQVESRYLNLRSREVEIYNSLISHIIYISPLRRLRDDVIRKNIKGQSGLWAYGISGDIPIVLVSIKKDDETDIIYDALKAHEYLRLKGLSVDLVILNEDESSYTQPFQDMLRNIISSSHARDIQDRHGGVFLRQGNTMPKEDRNLLYSIARIVLTGDGGPISKQLKLQYEDAPLPPKIEYKSIQSVYPTFKEALPELMYFNGIGGFYQDGKEYVIVLNESQHSPAPWLNVISNGKFGFQITESGGGYTWSENSRENKLTPWSNDPISDPPGEVIYLKDEDDGEYWSITPLPIREKESYIIRHGFGYSIFEHISHGIKQEMTVFTPQDDRIKIIKIKLRNISDRVRNLSSTYYIRPVLGVAESITAPYIVTEVHDDTKVLLIKNTYSDDFPKRVAFIDSSVIERSITGDRFEFLGREGSLENPEALSREKLSGRVGAGYDPCGALQIKLELQEGEEKQILFTLGQELSVDDALSSALKYRNIDTADDALIKVKEFWQAKLGTIQVRTPDKSLDIMANGWLLYQTIACRIFARSAFYQSGGAYGFRDQLQDVMAAAFVSPEIAKNQILYSSTHQFLEGDVQHWWHPVTDRGIRTKFSDDLLWLPYVTADYIERTKDYDILDIITPFLEDEPLKENEDERYNKPRISNVSESIYEHCIRAIDRSLKFGEHGIPLMGSGDWNDGMSTVGNKGKGESIWLGWFLYVILMKFADICKYKGDMERSQRYVDTAKSIVEAIEQNGWDGSWYRRAYFDNGTPLGSAQNPECQIDSLAQSWSVISGAGKPHRMAEAMKALEHYLIREDEGLIMLLTPPFDNSDLEPGYIKGYVPGVRENGGQYTHAAVWVILAFAKLGEGDKAWELFNMINPINHSRTSMEYARYKVEPYVMAADVYAVEPHIGRGGWTWYTGAAGWMYRVCLEYMLGFKLRGDELTIEPCIPKGWSEYSISYKYKDTTYNINIKNPDSQNTGVTKVTVDGVLMEDKIIHLIDDKTHHEVEVVM